MKATKHLALIVGALKGATLEQKHYPAGTSTSTNVRLTGRKATLFQWLAIPLWVPTGKDSVPTDSGHSVRVLLDPAARLELGARWVNS